jgi:hypothetical protein
VLGGVFKYDSVRCGKRWTYFPSLTAPSEVESMIVSGLVAPGGEKEAIVSREPCKKAWLLTNFPGGREILT